MPRPFFRAGEYRLNVARIGAELCIRLGDRDAASELYQAVHETNALPWARLGIARAPVEAGQLRQAGNALGSLISDQPAYADVCGVMEHIQLEHGDLEAAFPTYRSAVEITPPPVARLHKQGMPAVYLGAGEKATRAHSNAACASAWLPRCSTSRAWCCSR